MARQSEHQIQRDVLKTGGAGGFDGILRFVRRVDAVQGLEQAGVKRLDAKRDAVKAGVAQDGQVPDIHRAGIGFGGNFSVRRDRQGV